MSRSATLRPAASRAVQAVDKLLDLGAKSLVFDLRDNPGGLLSELITILDHLLPQGDLFVSVNGVNYQIKRGVTVQVPPEVAEVIQHSEEQDAQSAARMEAIIARGE